jgi:hypothetical protein
MTKDEVITAIEYEIAIDMLDDYIDRKIQKSELSNTDMFYILEADRLAEKYDRRIDRLFYY